LSSGKYGRAWIDRASCL